MVSDFTEVDFARTRLLRKEVFDLAELLADVRDELTPLAATRRQKIECDDGGSLRIEGDVSRLRDALDLLVVAVLNFSPKDAVVRLSLRRHTGVAELRIEGPFTDDAAKAGFLSAKATLEQHQGDLRVRTALNGGLCLSLRLPTPGTTTDLAPSVRGLSS